LLIKLIVKLLFARVGGVRQLRSIFGFA